MRVLHVTAGNLYGGVERIVVEVARQRRGTHAFAVCFDGRLARELRDLDAEVHVLGEVRFSRPLSVWRARRRLRTLVSAQPAAAVLGHSPWSYSLLAPAVRQHRALWAHDALSGEHWTERSVLRQVPDLVVCNSLHTRRAVDRWLPGHIRREVVYAPVGTAVVAAGERLRIRTELGAADGDTVILMASRFERWKGHEELLRAAARLTGTWIMWIAGGAQRPEEADRVEWLHALARELGIASRVRFLGERRDVPALLRAADLHCQPNIEPEPFGIAFVEALQAARPVVTSAAGGALEIVTPDCGILVPVRDVAAVASALQALIDDPVRRAALGANGPARAAALCDAAAQVAALEHALEAAVAA